MLYSYVRIGRRGASQSDGWALPHYVRSTDLFFAIEKAYQSTGPAILASASDTEDGV